MRTATSAFEFGDFRLDCDRCELSRAGRLLKLERKPMDLLVLLVAGNGRLVTRAEIAEQLWGSEIFVDTEHGINTAMRKIRQVLRDDPEQPRFVETVPTKGYRFIGHIVETSSTEAAAPIPVAEVPAEDTKPAAAGNADTATSPAVPYRRGVRFPLWVLASLVGLVLISLIVATRWNHARQGSAALKVDSLAVLPLDNLSGDPGQDYFADGMTDELITMLAKNSNLRIISRTSVMQYKRAHRSLPEIARGLGVDRILEGSVAHSNTGVHMTVQLIDARTDTHLWAESFDRDTSGSVSLPREVAQTVARKLRSAVPETASTRYVRPEAHDAYLHGRYLWFTNHNDKAGEYFLKATQLQPDYALAWTGVSLYYGVGAVEGEMNPSDSLPRAKAAALKAASLDDSLPEVHVTLGNLAFFADWNWQRAQQESSRAIELDPTLVEAYFLQSKIFTTLNRPAEAIGSARKAMELNPFARPYFLAMTLDNVRQYDAAIIEARARLESIPTDLDLQWMIQYAYRCKGMQNEAVQTAEKALQMSGENDGAAGVRQAFERGGYRAGLQRWLMDSKKRSQREYVSSYSLASLTAQLGQREQTLAFLEQGFQQDDPKMVFLQCDCEYDFLHSDERYRSLIKKMGLPPAY